MSKSLRSGSAVSMDLVGGHKRVGKQTAAFMKQPVPRRLGAVVVVAAVLVCPTARAGHQPPRESTLQLQNTAPSIDTLITRFLAALTAKDRKALQRLRVNERDYIDVIKPGQIEPRK